MLDFISPMWAGVILLVAVAGLIFKSSMVKGITNKFGSPIGLKADTVLLVLLIVGIVAGGFGFITGMVNLNVASIGTAEVVATTVGGLDLKIHDGLVNSTSTTDYYNDEETFLTLYSVDANIADGDEFVWNITIERELNSEDAVILVSCNVPDKEIDGVTASNIAEKTSGQIDLDINDGGSHSDDNTVYKRFSMAEGVNTLEVQVAFDQEETYHDGMSDLDDYVDAVCVVSGDDGSSASVTTRVLANS